MSQHHCIWFIAYDCESLVHFVFTSSSLMAFFIAFKDVASSLEVGGPGTSRISDSLGCSGYWWLGLVSGLCGHSIFLFEHMLNAAMHFFFYKSLCHTVTKHNMSSIIMLIKYMCLKTD